jgi:methyl-accepting chemotaxis protein
MKLRTKACLLVAFGSFIPIILLNLILFSQVQHNPYGTIFDSAKLIIPLDLVLVISQVVVYSYLAMVGARATHLVSAVKQFVKGDLTTKFEIDGNDEIGILATGLAEILRQNAKLVDTVKSSVTEISRIATDYSVNAKQIAVISQQTSSSFQKVTAGVRDQTIAIRNTRALVGQINTHMRDISKAAQIIVDRTNDKLHEFDQAYRELTSVQETMNAINSASMRTTETATNLLDRTKNLLQITNAISSMVDQTNLTVLNAALKSVKSGLGDNALPSSIEKAQSLCDECKAAADQATKLSEANRTDAEAIVSENRKIGSQSDAAVETIRDKIASPHQTSEVLKLSEAIAKGIREMSIKEQDFLGELSAAVSVIKSAGREDETATNIFISSLQEIAANVESNAHLSRELVKVSEKLSSQLRRYKPAADLRRSIPQGIVHKPDGEKGLVLASSR